MLRSGRYDHGNNATRKGRTEGQTKETPRHIRDGKKGGVTCQRQQFGGGETKRETEEVMEDETAGVRKWRDQTWRGKAGQGRAGQDKMSAYLPIDNASSQKQICCNRTRE